MRSHPLNPSNPVFIQRNSSKTLKCPKCNWHYKYQETLEIHMKEKHADSDVTCMFCLQNQPHPKLARGESYSCGYKPYRCELCKYSTTTKGNLSIHMQSDKHLHAVQEMPSNLSKSNYIQYNYSTSLCKFSISSFQSNFIFIWDLIWQTVYLLDLQFLLFQPPSRPRWSSRSRSE